MTSMTQLTVPNLSTPMRSAESARATADPAAMATRSVRASRRVRKSGGWVARTISSRDYGDAPRQTSDGHRLQRFQRGNVDDGHIIREAVRDVESAAVGAERELPGTLPDQNVLLDLVGLCVDHGNPVGTSQGHERLATVCRELQADGADVLLVDTWNIEVDDVQDLMASRIDDRDRAPDFRRHPQESLIRSVYRDPRPGVDQDVGHDLSRLRVDEMGHAGLFGRHHHGAPVPADGETFRLDPDLDLRDPLARGVVDHRDQGLVFI